MLAKHPTFCPQTLICRQRRPRRSAQLSGPYTQRLPPPGPCYVKASPLSQPPATAGVLEGLLRKDRSSAFPQRGGQVKGSWDPHHSIPQSSGCNFALLACVLEALEKQLEERDREELGEGRGSISVYGKATFLLVRASQCRLLDGSTHTPLSDPSPRLCKEAR